jgi:hypothetical protein
MYETGYESRTVRKITRGGFMNKSQATEIRRIVGILEEAKQDLEPIRESLEKEVDAMDDQQQAENPDLVNLCIEIIDKNTLLEMSVREVMDALELVEGGLKNEN